MKYLGLLLKLLELAGVKAPKVKPGHYVSPLPPPPPVPRELRKDKP